MIDLQNLGKFKLVCVFKYAEYVGALLILIQLGKGRIAKPFIVKTRFVSKTAEQKIKEAGGVIKLVA